MSEGKPRVKRFNALKTEFAKIFWLDRSSVFKHSAAVIAVSAVMGVLIVFFDMIIQYGLDRLFSI